MPLDSDERGLLEWIGGPGAAQYGECYGKALDKLLRKGLVTIKHGREHQGEFIAKGDSLMYQAVHLTDAGRAELQLLET